MFSKARGWTTLAIIAIVAAPLIAGTLAEVTGTWKWTVERNGNTIETTLKLKQDGEMLTGTISGRNNTETAIEDGKVEGDKVSFTVKREFNGNTIVIKYNGTATGDTIKGTTSVERDGETREREWEAKRSNP